MVTSSPKAVINLSFGIIISESTCSFNCSRPACATWTRLPSYANGRVTTATVKIPSDLAISATTGAEPVPVPPPMPVVIKSMFAPRMASSMASLSSWAAARPISGLAPAPKPRVRFVPNWILFAAWFFAKDCASVLALINSTPRTLLATILLIALQPPPPNPITLITAGLTADSATS